MKIRFVVWSVYTVELSLWPFLVRTHQEFMWTFPGFLSAIAIFALVSLMLLELPIWLLPLGSQARLHKTRTLVGGLFFLGVTTFITNPFDWIPQSNHLMREAYWDVFALNILGLLALWVIIHGLKKTKKFDT